MYSHPADAYMVRREGDTLIAVPVRLTNVRPADLDAARDDLTAGRIVFVAPRTMDEIVFSSYAPGVAAAFVRACGRERIAEIRIAAEGITLTHIPDIAYEALQEAA